MKLFSAILTIVLLLIGRQLGTSQSFVNLDFESANVTTIPGFSFYIATSNAIPGWANSPVAIIGGSSVIAYDTISLGGAAVILQDANSSFVTPLQGQYSILFQGFQGDTNLNDGNPLNASITQTGQIPVNTQSLTFWGNLSGMEVTIDGQIIPYNAIGSGANYTIYGADISEFAGQTETLSFVTPANSEALLDNIQFSSSTVPEPSVLGLCALGGLLLAWRRWKEQNFESKKE
jgi:hypothetical protein